MRSGRDAWPPHKHQQRPCSISVQSLLQLEKRTWLEEAAHTEGDICDGADRGEDICNGADEVGCGADDLELGRTPAHKMCLGATASNFDACMRDVVTHQKPLPDDSGSGR